MSMTPVDVFRASDGRLPEDERRLTLHPLASSEPLGRVDGLDRFQRSEQRLQARVTLLRGAAGPGGEPVPVRLLERGHVVPRDAADFRHDVRLDFLPDGLLYEASEV